MMAIAPAPATIAMVFERSCIHAGLGLTPSSTMELPSTSAITSMSRSLSAVVKTYVLLNAERLLMRTVRISSPARAGRYWFPK